jgi:hypothetical protein
VHFSGKTTILRGEQFVPVARKCPFPSNTEREVYFCPLVEISQPHYSPDLAPEDFFSLSYGENCPQMKKVSGC